MENNRTALKQFNQRYEETLNSGLSTEEKDRQFAVLMTDMEQFFEIPAMHNPEWENRNKAVIALYRKVSISRTI
jgi:hypothetical protein